MADVNTLIENVENLPSLPNASAQLVSMLGNEDVSINDIAEIVRVDESLSVAVMRYANSAAFGTPDRKFDLRESIVRLGRSTLSKLVLEQQAATLFSGGCEAFQLSREALWRGAIGGAIAAEELAAQHAPDLKEYAFVSALVRDVGKLVLDAHYGSQYAQAVHAEHRDDRTFTDAERSAFGFDHAEVGAALCRKWNLPDPIARAVEEHHEPQEHGAEPDLVSLVHAGDVIALWSGISIGSDGLCYELAPHVKRSLKLSRRAAERGIAAMWNALRDIECALGMNDSQSERSAA